MKVKCNKCGYIGDEKEFPKGRDFLQKPYISRCPKCDNWQSPGDASMRMFGGDRPFVFIRDQEPEDPRGATFHRADEAEERVRKLEEALLPFADGSAYQIGCPECRSGSACTVSGELMEKAQGLFPNRFRQALAEKGAEDE